MKPRGLVRVLAVDDNPNNLLSLEVLLSELDVELVKATSGEEALRQVLEGDFAVVLLDIQMPDMDGFETASLIRSRPRSRTTPIIFLTAFGHDDAKVRQGYALGAVDFLFKPLVPEILRTKVQVFIELHRKNEEVLHQAELLREASAREHEQRLAEERAAWERQALRRQMAQERAAAEALSQKAEELARTVEEKVRAEAALSESLDRIGFLANTASTLLSSVDEPMALEAVFDALSERLDLDLAWVQHLEDPERPWVRFRPEEAGEVSSDPKHPTLDTLASAHPPVADGLPPDLGHRLGMASLWVHRLSAQGNTLGAVVFGRRMGEGFTDEEQALLKAVAEQMALALDRLALVRRLQAQARRLEEADARKNEFLAMLGHELRNPLAPIVNALTLVGRHPRAHASFQPSVAAAERQALHMARLVDDLLDVSRITRGKIDLKPRRVSLSDVVSDAVNATMPLLEGRGQLLGTTLPEAKVTVEGDPHRLSQVLANLLNNASRYSGNDSRIHLRCDVDGGEVVIEVQDEGIGLPPDQLEAIFETFVQIDPSADRSRGGLGLGLSLVKSLVQLHGGTVTAHSDGLGRGTTMTVRAPIVVEPGAQTSVCPPQAPAAPRRIVLVEDNDDIRLTLRDLLEFDGHEVMEAPDGEAGVAAILDQQPNLALVDIGLPGLDGFEVARRVRSTLQVPIRLVALTGYGGAEVSQQVHDAGFDAHLVKPVQLDELYAAIAVPDPA